MQSEKNRVQVCSSIHRPVAGFIHKQQNFATSLPRFYHYRKPKIKRLKQAIYIEYWYRIPVKLREIYSNKEWYRFRVREDINRRGLEKEQYAEWLRNEIEDSLKRGYNPFNTDKENEFAESGIVEQPKELNATDALQLFIEAWRKRGLDKDSTLPKYERIVNRLAEWLMRKKIPYINIKDITTDHIELFLNDMKKLYGFGNREYNNHFTFTRTVFKYLVDKKYIAESPCKGIAKQKANTTKHRFYDPVTLNKLIKLFRLQDPYTLLAIYTVYYLAVRSEKELKNLKVGNIFWEQNKVLAEVTKGKTERYIPMDENIKEIFLSAGIDKYPADHYVFGIHKEPSVKPFGKGFFSKKFRKICNEAGLSKTFNIYSMKHTRVCDLKLAGANDADIMSLTGHHDFTSYAIYLKNLGLSADVKNINKVSRKI